MVSRTSLPSNAYQDIPRRVLRLHQLARMETLTKDVEKSMSTAQDCYKRRYLDKNMQSISTIDADQLVYMNKLWCAVFTSVADKVVISSNSKLTPRVLDQYEIGTVHDIILTIFEDGNESTICTDHAARATDISKGHDARLKTKHTSEPASNAEKRDATDGQQPIC